MINAQRAVYTQLVAPIYDRVTSVNTSAQTGTISMVGLDALTLQLYGSGYTNTSGNTGFPTIDIQESDTTTFSTTLTSGAISGFTTKVLLTGGGGSTTGITSPCQVLCHIDTKYRKKNLKVTITPATTTNDGITYGCLAVTSRREEAPASTTAMVGGGTNDQVFII